MLLLGVVVFIVSWLCSIRIVILLLCIVDYIFIFYILYIFRFRFSYTHIVRNIHTQHVSFYMHTLVGSIYILLLL